MMDESGEIKWQGKPPVEPPTKCSLFYTFGYRQDNLNPKRIKNAAIKFAGEEKYVLVVRRLEAQDLPALRLKAYAAVEVFFNNLYKSLHPGEKIKK